VIGSSTKLAATWFAPKERITAISLYVVGQSLGIALGLVFPALYFTSSMDKDTFKSTMEIFLGVQAAMAATQLMLNVLIYREKPSFPPGPEPSSEVAEDKPTFWEAFPLIVKNWGFMAINCQFFLLQSTQNALSVVLGEISVVYGFTATDGSLIGCCCILGGVIGSVVYGKILQRTGAYKTLIMIIAGMACLVFVLIRVLITLGSLPLLSTLAFALGFNLVAIAPILYDLGVEQLYPLGESYSPTFLSMFDSAGSLLLTEYCSWLLDKADFLKTGSTKGGDQILMILPAMALIATLLSFTYSVELKRQEAIKKSQVETKIDVEF
jgi:MFS transporter, FLVCR family, feline leukemia virus subgroup C receptor-related protein